MRPTGTECTGLGDANGYCGRLRPRTGPRRPVVVRTPSQVAARSSAGWGVSVGAVGESRRGGLSTRSIYEDEHQVVVMPYEEPSLATVEHPRTGRSRTRRRTVAPAVTESS